MYINRIKGIDAQRVYFQLVFFDIMFFTELDFIVLFHYEMFTSMFQENTVLGEGFLILFQQVL